MATNLSNLDSFFGASHKTDKKEKSSAKDVTNINSIDQIMDLVIKHKISCDPLDIREVVRTVFEIDINETDLGKSVSGFLERIGNRWAIYINKNESEVRKRFTIAHELGHFIYHSDKYVGGGTSIPDQIFFRDYSTNPMEQEANNFAAALLMPEDTFRKYIDEGYDTVSTLADKFQLSTSAIKYRAYKLGLISEYA